METIEDIVREMREYVNAEAFIQHEDGDVDFVDICGELADRIEAAAKATVRTDNSETLHNLLDENARLRAALKPVLKVLPEKNWWNRDAYLDKCQKAIVKAQKIFAKNESEEK